MCERNQQNSKQENKRRKPIAHAKQTPSDDWYLKLTTLQENNQFSKFEQIGNTVKIVCQNSKSNVTAMVDIWKSKELFIRIIFSDRKEIVEIDDKSFGTLAAEQKIVRLNNFIERIKRIGSKDELFPVNLNWADFIERNYENFDYRFP